MNILLIGAPGSGKGTQAEKLVSTKGFVHLSTGDLFRKNLKEQTTLGKKAKSYIDRGALVPDEITNSMVEDFLNHIPTDKGIVFDGFPRNLFQAEVFDQILNKTNRPLDKVIFLDISDDEIVERLTGRLWAPKSGRVYHIKNNPPQKQVGFCDQSGEKLMIREDDKEEIVRSRLKVFHKETKPLLNLYTKRSCLKTISSAQSPEEVFNQILQTLDEL